MKRKINYDIEMTIEKILNNNESDYEHDYEDNYDYDYPSDNNYNVFNIEKVQNKDLLEEIKDIVVCMFCHRIIREPFHCSTCNIVFCKICIGKWEKENKNENEKCPLKCKNGCVEKAPRIIRNILAKIIFEGGIFYDHLMKKVKK